MDFRSIFNVIKSDDLTNPFMSGDTSITKGDVSGHVFHGNQWEQVDANSANLTEKVRNAITDNGTLNEGKYKNWYPNGEKCKAEVCKDIASRLGDKYDKQLKLLVKPADRKDMVGSGEKAQGLREQAVSKLVNSWAKSSNNGEPRPLALQKAAIDEFGLKGAQTNEDWLSKSPYAKTGQADGIQEDADKNYAKYGDLYRGFLRAQYESTQEFFAKNGVTQIPVYRGLMWYKTANMTPEWAKQDGQANIGGMRPLTSWSYREQNALAFANDAYNLNNYDRAVISATVPASSVLSCARTGIGCLSEREIVVLGTTTPTVNVQVNPEFR
jgi:hypothetical protein